MSSTRQSISKNLQEYCNPRSFVYSEQHIRRALKWCIENFDREIPQLIWATGSRMRVFYEQRAYQCPQLLKKYVEHGVITLEESLRTHQLLNSDDREDWFVAFNLILNIKSNLKLRKNEKH